MALSAWTIVLAAGTVLAAALTIWADQKKRHGLFQRVKPLTTTLIIAVAAIAPVPLPAAYKVLILAGLVASLVGDIALALPEKWFPTGLGAFLVAQVLYIMAFRPGPERSVSFGVFLPFILYGLLVYFILRPGLGPLKIPVLVYVAAIVVMAGFAANRYVNLGGVKPLLAFVGAVLFLISDSVLAYDRFGKKLGPAAQIVILGTYFPAQLLIALSV